MIFKEPVEPVASIAVAAGNVARFSVETHRDDAQSAPPFTDACPRCVHSDFVFVPYATTTQADKLTAFYRHRACGYQWSCGWDAHGFDTEEAQG